MDQDQVETHLVWSDQIPGIFSPSCNFDGASVVLTALSWAYSSSDVMVIEKNVFDSAPLR